MKPDENYDDDEHIEDIRNRIFARYNEAMKRLAEEEKNEQPESNGK